MTGRDIRAERQKRGIALGALAEAVGIEQPVLRAIENECIEVTPAQLVRLWNAMDALVPSQAQSESAA